MKKAKNILIGAISLLFFMPAQAAPLPAGQEGGWRLTFQDEFDGSALDAAKWQPQDLWCGIRNNELQAYQPANARVSGGLLRLVAEKRSANLGYCGDSGIVKWYASGIAITMDKFDQQYGYFEARAKSPKGKGLWPAFWLMPYHKWPPEIDVMEILGQNTTTMYMTNHWGSSSMPQKNGSSFSGVDFSGDFHIFGAKWTSSDITWYVDGVEKFRSAYGIPNEPFFVILNLAVGGNWPGPPDAATVFPSEFQVDYVRVWQAAPECAAKAYSGCIGNNAYWYDSCGNQGNLNVACSAGQICSNGACAAACVAKTCAETGAACGSISDGCGGTVNCGNCASGYSCANNQCVADIKSDGAVCTNNSECQSGLCSYGTCCAAGQCGWGDDGAGGPRMCVDRGGLKENQWLKGVCRQGTWRTAFGGHGCNSFACDQGVCQNNFCKEACVPKTCADLGKDCGSWGDGCGGNANCGVCAQGKSCSSAGKCVDEVVPVPWVDIKVAGNDGPVLAKANSSIALSWVSNNAVGCTASGDWFGNKALFGTENVVLSSDKMVFSISCSGTQGTATDSITVNAPPANFGIELADLIKIAPNDSANLSARITGAAPFPLVYKWACDGGNLSDDASLSTVYTAPNISSAKYYVCTITVRGGEGVEVSKSVSIDVRPVPQNIVKLQKQIAELEALIESLQKQLAALDAGNSGYQGTVLPPAEHANYSCSQITKYLAYGMQNDLEVKCLQEFLAAQGLFSVTPTGNYYSLTKAAVKAFQGTYAAEILAPHGLAAGSGNVGNDTRRKINAIMAAS